MLKLRNYQERAVQDIRQSFIQGNRAPLLVLPTGGGKTVVFSYIAATTAARAKRVLILVHRVELLRQTSAALTKAGVRHGLINPNYTPDLFAPVQVASVQTLIRRLHQVKDPDLIVVDEAHHAVAGTWRKIIEAYPNARVLGVTATPCRADGSGLGKVSGGMFDDLILGPQVNELIGMGFLVKPVIYAPAQRLDLSGLRTKMGDYDNQQLEEFMDKPTITGDAVAHYQKLCPGTPAVAFCVSVRHAQHVAEEFRAAGYRAYHADGSLDDDVRRRILGGLGNGTVDVVTSCDLISEGTDIPAIGAAILLRPTQSLGLYLQQVGRALRPCAGKDRAIILDHVGNVLTHGLPDEVREWTLEGERKKKKGAKEQEKTIPVKQCERCYAIHEPAPMCPVCGFEYVVAAKGPQQVDGELAEITPERAAAIRRQKVVEVAKARTLEELEAIAKSRGYKLGWAKHIWNSRQAKSAANF
jgi:DNA repair protein RadD